MPRALLERLITPVIVPSPSADPCSHLASLLTGLPDEVLAHVLSFALGTQQDVAAVSVTSARLRKISRIPKSHKNVVVKILLKVYDPATCKVVLDEGEIRTRSLFSS